jgi:dTDP-4-dehydrorhamnose reductase
MLGMKKNKILILGGSGMLGHKVYQQLSKKFETWVTFRNYKSVKNLSISDDKYIIDGLDVFSFPSVREAFNKVKPDTVINCIGVIKQLKDATNPKMSIYINSLLPHLLDELCTEFNSKLIHISTDCIFSGSKGMYTEEDISDASDLYGRTKFLGEISNTYCLTLRTSIIGHELNSSISLVDWFIFNKYGNVKGFKKAIYSGFPTITFAKELIKIIENHLDLSGLYQISSSPISKYDLLSIINKVYDCQMIIEPDFDFECDRSLDSIKYRKETGFQPVSWEEMIMEMYNDYQKTNYKNNRTL